MTNTSATGGYLLPAADASQSLSRTLQQFIVGVSGLPGALVRPMWQRKMPAIPENGIDWCAFAVTNVVADQDAYQVQQATLTGTDCSFQKSESFDLDCVFYGDNCFAYASLFRDGVTITQNREAIAAVGIKVNGTSGITHAPELINSQWQDRCDITAQMSRWIDRTYQILHFTGASGWIFTESLAPIPFGVSEPERIFDSTFDWTFQ